MPGPLHLLVADDQPFALAGLRRLLHPHASHLFCTDSTKSLHRLLAQQPINLLILGFLSSASRFAGISLLQAIHRERPALAVVLRSSVNEPHLQVCARALGAQGYLAAEAQPEEILEAIRMVARGGT